MNEEERKQLAYIAGLLLKVACDYELTMGEMQSLKNIVDDLGYHNIEEDYFRW